MTLRPSSGSFPRGIPRGLIEAPAHDGDVGLNLRAFSAGYSPRPH